MPWRTVTLASAPPRRMWVPLQFADVIVVGRVPIPWQRSAVEPILVTAEVGRRLDKEA